MKAGQNSSEPRVAIVCDWLVGTGGAERVVLQLHKIYPDAPIYTSQYNSDPSVWHNGKWFSDAHIRTGWLQRLPLGLRKFLPLLRAIYFSQLKLDGYDLIISVTGAEAKAVRARGKAIHICYCLAPTHYYWSRYDEYLARPGFGKLDWLARIGLRLLAAPMRRWDRRAAQRPDYMVGISEHIRQQIEKYYNRQASVIHPPVETERFTKYAEAAGSRSGFVAAGRQTPYKKIDLAVAACTELNLPLTVIGSGPDHSRLVKLAGPTVKFVAQPTDDEVAEILAGAEAFIFPGVDDFGIVAVEALAAGTPVIAYGEGGALDYVRPGKTGELFAPQTTAALVGCLGKFKAGDYKAKDIRASAELFSLAGFRAAFRKLVDGIK